MHGVHRVREYVRALAEIVQHQGRQHQPEPRQPYGPAAEMTHVGVQRLAAGYDQEDSAQDQERVLGRAQEQRHGQPGIDGLEHLRVRTDGGDPQGGEDNEPDNDDRSEQAADLCGPAFLKEKQQDQDGDGNRDDQMAQVRGGDLQAFHRAQHGNGGRQHTVAEQQGGPEYAQQYQCLGHGAFEVFQTVAPGIDECQ